MYSCGTTGAERVIHCDDLIKYRILKLVIGNYYVYLFFACIARTIEYYILLKY